MNGVISERIFSKNYSPEIMRYLEVLANKQVKKYEYRVPREPKKVKLNKTSEYAIQDFFQYPLLGIQNPPQRQFAHILRNYIMKGKKYVDANISSSFCIIGKNETDEDVLKRPTLQDWIEMNYIRNSANASTGTTMVIIPDGEYSQPWFAQSLEHKKGYKEELIDRVSDIYVRMIKKVDKEGKINVLRTSEHNDVMEKMVSDLPPELKDIPSLFYNNRATDNDKWLAARYGIEYSALDWANDIENFKYDVFGNRPINDELPIILIQDVSEQNPAKVANTVLLYRSVKDIKKARTWNVTKEERKQSKIGNKGVYFAPYINSPGLDGGFSEYRASVNNKILIGDELDTSENKLVNASKNSEGRQAIMDIAALLPNISAEEKCSTLFANNVDAAAELIMKEIKRAQKVIL